MLVQARMHWLSHTLEPADNDKSTLAATLMQRVLNSSLVANQSYGLSGQINPAYGQGPGGCFGC